MNLSDKEHSNQFLSPIKYFYIGVSPSYKRLLFIFFCKEKIIQSPFFQYFLAILLNFPLAFYLPIIIFQLLKKLLDFSITFRSQ